MSSVHLCLYAIDAMNTVQHAAILVHGHIISYNENGYSIEPEENCRDWVSKNYIGVTSKQFRDIQIYARNLYESDYDDEYNILTKNCYHFANDVSKYLCDEDIMHFFNNQVLRAGMTAPVAATSYVITQLTKGRGSSNQSSSSSGDCVLM